MNQRRSAARSADLSAFRRARSLSLRGAREPRTRIDMGYVLSVDFEEGDNEDLYLRVRWLGFEPADDTWEPVAQLIEDQPRMVLNFFKTRTNAHDAIADDAAEADARRARRRRCCLMHLVVNVYKWFSWVCEINVVACASRSVGGFRPTHMLSPRCCFSRHSAS